MIYKVNGIKTEILEKNGYIYNASTQTIVYLFDQTGAYLPIYPEERFKFNIQDHEKLFLKTTSREVDVSIVSCCYIPRNRATIETNIPDTSTEILEKNQYNYIK